MADVGPQSQKFVGLKSERGFLAMQSLVAAAIVGIMLAVLMGVIGNVSTFNEKYRVKEEMDNTIQKVRNVLQREETCTVGLQGPGGGALTFVPPAAPDAPGVSVGGVAVANSGGGVTQIIQRDTTPQFEIQGQARPARFSIGALNMTEVTFNSGRSTETVTETSAPNPPVYNTYLVNLNIPVLLNNTPFRTQSVALKIYTDPAQANRIVKCFTVGTDNRICGGFGGDVNPTTGRCRLPVCDATEADRLENATPRRGRTCSGRTNCTVTGYYWVFQGALAASDDGTLPWCVCLENCS